MLVLCSTYLLSACGSPSGTSTVRLFTGLEPSPIKNLMKQISSQISITTTCVQPQVLAYYKQTNPYQLITQKVNLITDALATGTSGIDNPSSGGPAGWLSDSSIDHPITFKVPTGASYEFGIAGALTASDGAVAADGTCPFSNGGTDNQSYSLMGHTLQTVTGDLPNLTLNLFITNANIDMITSKVPHPPTDPGANAQYNCKNKDPNQSPYSPEHCPNVNFREVQFNCTGPVCSTYTNRSLEIDYLFDTSGNGNFIHQYFADPAFHWSLPTANTLFIPDSDDTHPSQNLRLTLNLYNSSVATETNGPFNQISNSYDFKQASGISVGAPDPGTSAIIADVSPVIVSQISLGSNPSGTMLAATASTSGYIYRVDQTATGLYQINVYDNGGTLIPSTTNSLNNVYTDLTAVNFGKADHVYAVDNNNQYVYEATYSPGNVFSFNPVAANGLSSYYPSKIIVNNKGTIFFLVAGNNFIFSCDNTLSPLNCSQILGSGYSISSLAYSPIDSPAAKVQGGVIYYSLNVSPYIIYSMDTAGNPISTIGYSGTTQTVDGPFNYAFFYQIVGLTVDSSAGYDVIYAAQSDYAIRKIDNSTHMVSTVIRSGVPGGPIYRDSYSTQFKNNIRTISADGQGHLFTVDDLIEKIQL